MSTRSRLAHLASEHRCPTCAGSGIAPPPGQEASTVRTTVVDDQVRADMLDLVDRIALEHTPDDQVVGPLDAAASVRDPRFADVARAYLAALDE